MKKIIFICTGNTCRSPMAAAFFNYFAELETPGFGYQAASAGLAVSGDAPPSENAVSAMLDSWSIDISSHRAHILDKSEVDGAFLLLTMQQSHRNYIRSMFSGAYQKVFSLKEYVYGEPLDVDDPYGGSIWTYKKCAAELEKAVELLVEKLKKS